MLTYCKQVEAKTASTRLTCLYFYLHISIRIFCTLFICFELDGLLNRFAYKRFVPNIRLLLKTRTY